MGPGLPVPPRRARPPGSSTEDRIKGGSELMATDVADDTPAGEAVAQTPQPREFTGSTKSECSSRALFPSKEIEGSSPPREPAYFSETRAYLIPIQFR